MPLPVTVVNPSFEAGDLTGWTAYSTGATYAAPVVTTSSPGPYDGSYYLNAGNPDAGNHIGVYQDITIDPAWWGVDLLLSVQTRQSASTGAAYSHVQFDFYDSGDALIGTPVVSQIDPYALFGIETWGEHAASAPIPTDAAYVRVRLARYRITTTGVRIHFDALTISVDVATTEAWETQLGQQVTLSDEGSQDTTQVGQEVSFSETGQVTTTQVIMQVLRSVSGEQIPVTMLIPTGWDPAIPILPTITDE